MTWGMSALSERLQMGIAAARRIATRSTRSTRWLVRINLVCVLGFCAVSAVMLWNLRTDAFRQSEITSRSLVAILGRDIARNIDLYDLSLLAVVDELKQPAIAGLSPELRQTILFDRASSATGFGRIIVLNEGGKLMFSSKPVTAPNASYATNESFRYFSTHVDDDIHISAPLISHVSGQRVIVLSRRYTKADGSFGGVVSGAILLNYLHGLFAAAGVDRSRTVTLYGSGGTIVVREPFDEASIDTNVGASESYRKMTEAESGSFVGPAMVGTGERHFAFARVGRFPLILSTAVAPEVIYAGWLWKAVSFGMIILTLCAVTLVLARLFNRELIERQQAERSTAAVNVELQKLATTDALTGLANRRRFDEVLARGWRRSLRLQQPLSLLLLDADCFKGFNDHYGHQRGDDVLKLIARAIEASIDPESAIACRIGGEEFAVLFSDTSARLAEAAAERMRELVLAWRLPHAANTHGFVTISGGLARRTPATGEDASALVAAADEALYQAKQAGRDLISVAPPTGQRRRSIAV